MTRPVTRVETHPLTGEDARPIPIVSPTSVEDLRPIPIVSPTSVEDLTTMIDPGGNPKQIDPSKFGRSPIHEQLRLRNNGKQRGWLQACLVSLEMKSIFMQLARATSSGFREGNLAESLCFGWNVNESEMENILSRADFPAFPMPVSECAETQDHFIRLLNQSLNWKYDPNSSKSSVLCPLFTWILYMNGIEERGWLRKCLGLKKKKDVEVRIVLLFKCLAYGSKIPDERSFTDLLEEALGLAARTIGRHVADAKLPFINLSTSTPPAITAENNTNTETPSVTPNLVLDEEEENAISVSAISVPRKIKNVTSEGGRKVTRSYFLVPDRRGDTPFPNFSEIHKQEKAVRAAEFMDELVGEENRAALIHRLVMQVLDAENQESLLSELSDILKKKDATTRPNRAALIRKLAMEVLDVEDQKSLLSDLSESLNKDKAPCTAIAEIQKVSKIRHVSEIQQVSVSQGFYNGILKALSGGSFQFSAISKLMLGFLFASHPTISAIAWEQSIVFILRAFFITSGWGDHPSTSVSELQRICPGTTTIDNLVMDFAAHSQIMSGNSLNGPGSWYLSFDKADKTKGGIGGCMKLTAVHDERLVTPDFPDGQIIVAPLDADKTGDTSEDVAAGVHRSVCRLGLREEKKQASGSTWDSGGGGVGDSVDSRLKVKTCVRDHGLRANCTCHNMNLEIKVPLVKALKATRGTNLQGQAKDKHADRDVEQLLYSAWAWENESGKELMKLFWESNMEYAATDDRDINITNHQDNEDEDDELPRIVPGDQAHGEWEGVRVYIKRKGNINFIAMKKGCETRWFTIGEAACVLWDTLNVRYQVAKNYDKMKQDGKARNICQTFLSLVEEPALLADVCLLSTHHRYYLEPHLKFYQNADNLTTKRAGHQAFNVLSRCFLQYEDYQSMKGYETLEEFEELVSFLNNRVPEVQRDMQRKKYDLFFEIGMQEHQKMARMFWLHPNELVFLACFSELPTSRLVCQRLRGLPFCANPEKSSLVPVGDSWKWVNPVSGSSDGDDFFDFVSVVHQRTIDLEKFAAFLEQEIPDGATINAHHVEMNLELIDKIARGNLNIWDRDDPETLEPRLAVLRQYGAIFSSTQGAERGNKLQNLAASHHRKETSTSVRVVASSHIKEQGSVFIIGESSQKRGHFKGRKQLLGMEATFEEFQRKQQIARSSYGEGAYKLQKQRAKEGLKKSYSKERNKEIQEAYEKELSNPHMPSAKQLVSGVDYSALVQGKLWLTKVFDKIKGRKTNNEKLLKEELSGRKSSQLNRALNADEITAINRMKYKDLKANVKAFEDERVGDQEDYNGSFILTLHTAILDYELSNV
jgi:hypothetical protein